MSDNLKLEIVGTGQRGRNHARECYDVREEEYVFASDDDYLDRVYDEFSNSGFQWVEIISDLFLTMTALMVLSKEELEQTKEIWVDHGDDS